MCEPKKFDLVQQTVSPRERVGSGDETTYLYAHVGVHITVGNTHKLAS